MTNRHKFISSDTDITHNLLELGEKAKKTTSLECFESFSLVLLTDYVLCMQHVYGKYQLMTSRMLIAHTIILLKAFVMGKSSISHPHTNTILCIEIINHGTRFIIFSRLWNRFRGIRRNFWQNMKMHDLCVCVLNSKTNNNAPY